jgi:hypothetical protein
MRPKDIEAFLGVAKRFQVWILLRASKASARDYIGKPGYVPKRLDCKAKTADFDVTLPGLGAKKTAGLVVDPTIHGMEQAFEKPARALHYWDLFKDRCYLPKTGGPPLTYFPAGKLYSVQTDEKHPHYGCVLFSSWSNAAAGRYIHSDYDLYGIVRAADPSHNVRVVEERLGETHSRGQEFFDIQHDLNKRMGLAMVLHGEQEKYSDDVNDNLDVFCPDGATIIQAYGAGAIRKLYSETFQGRPLFGRNANPKPFFGKWQTA